MYVPSPAKYLRPVLCSYDDFPPLPPPLVPFHPRVTRNINVCKPVRSCPVNVSHTINVCKPVRQSDYVHVPLSPVSVSVSRSIPHPVPQLEYHPVIRKQRPSFMSNHTLPLRRLNKVKPPKYEKCEYIHLPYSHVSVSVPRLVPSPVIHRRHRRRNRRYRNRCVNDPVKCNVNRPITPPSSTSAQPPSLPPHPSLSPSSIPPQSSTPHPSPSYAPPPSSSFAPPPSPTSA